ncbi:pectinesterase family protein [Paenibacillus sp. FSL W8-0426]|uniref:pectinesterase family protein n=1 Tax=Paenibacillus sp. FSL W8-0426 TaxID=2921714 RepID=UPI0030D8F46E
MKRIVSLVLVISMLFSLLPAMAAAEEANEAGSLPAFPGAEGGGKYVTGGRGGAVYEVTTLADSGPGSLREAVSQNDTTVVFRVGGTIHLESPLAITGSNLTLAGQTAPGEGITVSDYWTTFQADNIIVRHMRFRLGDKHPSEDDVFGGRYHKNIIIDHCSFAWSVDEVLSMYVNENTTVQWSVIAESMLMTTHQKGRHGYAGIWGGNNASFHHNIIAHNVSRNPRFAGSPGFNTESYNNVVYNWGFFSAYGGEEGNYNLMNNYYKYGPNTYRSARDQVFLDVSPNTRLYVGGNVVDGFPEVTADNWLGVGELANPESKLSSPVEMAHPSPVDDAETAYERVLAEAGAVLPRRDAIDARIVNDVKNRTGQHINSQKEVGGYLEFEEAVSTLADRDRDGMPDDWEISMGLNPDDPNDRNGIHESGYTYLEVYLNGIVGNGSANPAVTIDSPANHTITTQGASVEITASASDSDGTVSKVEFYQNDVKLGEDDTAPYTFTWENVQDGTHYLTVRAIDDTGTATQSNNVTVHVHKESDIAPWQSTDIGTPGIAGHTQIGSSVTDITVKSAGDIHGDADHFHYAYQTLEGNGEIVAKVERVTATDDGAEAGVMIRGGLEPSAPFAALMVSYAKGGQKAVGLTRENAGKDVIYKETDTFISLPYWVKLVRLGDRVTSSVSKDGNDWSVTDSVYFSKDEPVYIGLAADASKPDDEVDKLNTSVFSNAAVHELPADFPLPPSHLSAVPGPKSVVLTWDEVENASSYSVFRSEISGGPYTKLQQGLGSNSYTDSNLTVGKTYYYVVKAENDKGISLDSSEASAVPEGDLETIYYIDEDFEEQETDTTPTGYVVSPDPQDADHKVVIAGVPSGTSGNSSAKALMLYDNAPGTTQFIRAFQPPQGNFVFETDIMSPGWPGTSYLLQLQNSSGSRTALSIEIRKPSAPVAEDQYTLVYKKDGADHKLMDVPAANQWYNLKITVNAASQKADIYIDNVRVADNVPFQADVTGEGIGRISARTPGTGKGTIYYDNIRLYVEPVATPKGLVAQPGNGMVRLDWEETEGASTYNVKRSDQQGSEHELVASNVAETHYIDETVVNGTTYSYVITATGPLGESGPSNLVQVTPSEDAVRPDAPENLQALARDSQAKLTWQGVDQASYYTVKRGTREEGPFVTVASRTTRPFYRDGGLENGTTYYYVVSATGIGGEGADAVPVAVTPTAALSTPTAAVESLPNAVRLVWEPVEGAAAYLIKRADSVEGPYEIIAEGETGTSYTDTGLRNGKPYYYKVVAVSGHTHSLDSTAAGTRPAANDGTPQIPSGLRAEAQDGGVVLRWNEAEGADGYAVKRSHLPEGPFVPIASDLNGTTYTDLELDNGSTYYYVVTAHNEAGESMSSVPVSEIPAPVLTVASDGSAQFERVQDAIDAVPDQSPTPTIIRIQDGTYREKLNVPSSKTNLRMIGESREGTVLVYGDSASTLDAAGNPLGTSNSYSFRVQTNDFTAEHLTIQNDAGDNAGQAVALFARGDRLVFRDVSLKGWQDTLYVNDGRQYYVDSYIEGDVDFIFGNAAAMFENSIIHSLSSGYVTAASTAEGKPGYVFLGSRITAEPGLTGKVALGRPWRPNANVVYINNYMDDHISPSGWNNWGNTDNERTARFAEYASYGPGAAAKSRYNWSSQLTAEEAAEYLPARHLAGEDGWNPASKLSWVDANRELSKVFVDGEPVADFDPTRKEYSLVVADAGELPVVTAEAASAKAKVHIEQADSMPGQATIRVTGQDGGESEYVIHFTGGEEQDTTPPTLRLKVNKPVLKAKGNKLETIRVTANAEDEGSGVASIVLVSITSNQPKQGKGKGNSSPDIVGAKYGTPDYEFKLRAERSGKGKGEDRIYTITYEAADHAGNKTRSSVTVTVKK